MSEWLARCAERHWRSGITGLLIMVIILRGILLCLA